MSSKIVYVARDVDLRLGHEGLIRVLNRSKFMKEREQTVENLPIGSLIFCINTQKTKLKAIGGHGMVLGYLRTPKNQRLYDEALQYLPETFGADGFDYDAASKRAMKGVVSDVSNED